MSLERRFAELFGPRRRFRVPLGVAAAAAALGLPGAHADVYKCAGDGGTPVYQEMPCPPGKELRNFQTNPPEITVLPARPAAGATAGATASANSHAKTTDKPEKPSATGGSAKVKGDPAERANAHVGMTESEVLAKLGPPDVTSGQPNQKQLRWTWLPAEGDPEMVTTITLTDGIVTDLERRTVKK